MSRKKWLGGYVHTEKDGRPLFVIERQVRGRRFHVSTRCNTERGALQQLARFEADPFGYRPEGDVGEEPLLMTAELIAKFHAWSVDVRGNTEKHAVEMTNRLSQWAEVLDGVDLRKATLREHIVPPLDQWAGRQHRIIALKSFYAWLRKERHLLTSAQDPTLDLPVPQAVPEKHKRRKAVEWERVQAAFRHLAPPYRDVLQLLVATGWHVTELERFVRASDSSITKPPTRVVDRQGREVLAVLCTLHKTGKQTRTPLMERAHVEAAERLRARGEVPRRLNEALASACKAADVTEFTLGVMRHSVATWALELGATPKEAADHLGHESERTTLRFYADVAVPTSPVPTRVLTD